MPEPTRTARKVRDPIAVALAFAIRRAVLRKAEAQAESSMVTQWSQTPEDEAHPTATVRDEDGTS